MEEFYKEIQGGNITHVGYEEGNQCIINQLVGIEITKEGNIVFRYEVSDKNIIVSPSKQIVYFFTDKSTYKLLINERVRKDIYFKNHKCVEIFEKIIYKIITKDTVKKIQRQAYKVQGDCDLIYDYINEQLIRNTNSQYHLVNSVDNFIINIEKQQNDKYIIK